ncbi:SUMO protein smt3 [Entomophthora muscae]|uniref:SUMO protein smt3 n=1 Tax=Entomophthora muscae TaxID=34485 RepID=A0ACC2T2R6_9FUNG|nr:SUMO protein smt3 [Entomophthora muscae]
MSDAPSPKEEKKIPAEEETTTATEHINLKVVGSDHAEVLFKIKKHTPLKKLMDAYCTRQGKTPSSVRFLYDGVRIQPTNTPVELEMDDGDSIDVMVEQLGGSL